MSCPGGEVGGHRGRAVGRASRARGGPFIWRNCASVLDMIAGIGQPGVPGVWLDPHDDSPTPEIADSGFLDNGSVAVLTGNAKGSAKLVLVERVIGVTTWFTRLVRNCIGCVWHAVRPALCCLGVTET